MAGVIVRDKVAVFLVYLFSFVLKCEANDILGCGGFVKSHVSLDFSKIEIGLYTKEGSLKEKTECAPTNGYYFLPLYEKGEYVLKVHPPPGWSFEPSEVKLAIDGSSDHCSTGQDINFDFNGFGITGKVVTNGQSHGPSGISVQLVNEKGETRDTVTVAGGDFHFTPVIPGKYTIKASHPRWKLEPSQAAVHVKEGNTALAIGSLAVKGYDVHGTVHSYGNPVAGLHVLLYSKEENPKYRVEGCKTALLQGVPESPICYSVTDASGEFSFGLVPAGEYKLVALAKPPGQAIIRYNVRPESVPFSVLHDSQFIKNAFEVEGYTITGSVVGAAGSAVAGARVSLDGRPVSNTDSAGKYTLPSLQPGTYTLTFHHEQCEFDDVKLSISTSGSVTLNEARAARWKVCGAVTPADPRDVTLAADRGSLVTTVTVSHDNNGKWCTFLPPGAYTARVEVSEREKRDGLQFYPLSQKITVTNSPVEDVTFSQLYATVSGVVECSRPECAGVKVTLRSLAVEGAPAVSTTTPDKDGKYTFEHVLPGTIEVWVPSERLCWATDRHSVRVTSSTARVPHFQHTGYVLTVRSQHAVTVEYVGASDKESGSVSLVAGDNRVCVPAAGRYTLTPRSCHKYQPASVLADTANQDAVSLVAVAHSVDIQVLSPVQVSDLVLKINTNDKGSKDVGPLKAEAVGDQFLYKHTLFLAEGEVIVVSASSSSLLFTPHTPQQVLGTAECQPAGLVLHARQGLTLRGRIVPPVQGAQVTLTSATEDLRLTLTTGPDGTYSFGPLDASQSYSITAEKDSYVMGAAQPNGDIVAHKLAEITVQLRDEASGALLQGALVSVSGGSYRKNQVSGASGELRFSSLAPGQYYVKPLMKEYRFSPPHHLLDVAEGLTSAVTLQGMRVAWSCSGALVSLGGAGWARALLSAQPQREGGSCRTEDALTDQDGTFRIRGLLPECVYTLQLKETPDLPALRLATPSPTIVIKESKDIENVRLIAIQPHQLTDANVLVRTPNVEHYKTLRLKLALEATPTAIIYSTKLDATGYHGNNNPGLMYVLPRLPADNKTYVLVLESTLSKSTHAYGEEVLYFNSDGQFKHFDIEFLPKVKTGEQELRQSSLLVVPLLAALALAFFYRETLLTRAAALANTAAARAQARPPRAAPRPDLLDKASIDHILNTVNATGRKTKTKKVQ